MRPLGKCIPGLFNPGIREGVRSIEQVETIAAQVDCLDRCTLAMEQKARRQETLKTKLSPAVSTLLPAIKRISTFRSNRVDDRE